MTLSPCQIRHQGDLHNGWHEVAYPVIILSYDQFGMVVHSQTLHIEITTECWYSPLEIGHLESRRLAVLFTDTLLLQLASWITHDQIWWTYFTAQLKASDRVGLIWLWLYHTQCPFIIYYSASIFWFTESLTAILVWKRKSRMPWIQYEQGHVLMARDWKHILNQLQCQKLWPALKAQRGILLVVVILISVLTWCF